MISIVLLIKIIGVICFAVVWLCMYRTIRRTVRRLEYLRAHCDARLDALAQYTGLTEGGGAPEAALAETRQKALEAERRFTEGIASILNFSHTSAQADVFTAQADVFMPEKGMPADMVAASDSSLFGAAAGRKGESCRR